MCCKKIIYVISDSKESKGSYMGTCSEKIYLWTIQLFAMLKKAIHDFESK